MTNSAILRGCASPVTPSFTPVTKDPRERLWRLDIECRDCTEALPRLFGLLAQHEVIPATIDYRKAPDGFAMTLIVALADASVATLLTGRIERIVTLTKVGIQQCVHL